MKEEKNGNEKERGEYGRFQTSPSRREIQENARFWAYKVARKDKKSVKKVLLSLDKKSRKSPI